MSNRLGLVAFAAAAAFLGAYALGGTGETPEPGPSRPVAETVVPAGKAAPVSRRVPVPATARLPGLRDAPAARVRRRVVAAPRPAPARAPTPAPAPAPAAPPPKPKPDPGTPFFNAQ
jgi:hypothetical protein